MVAELTGLRDEPTIIIRLNVHRLRLPSKFESPYLEVSGTLGPHERRFFMQWVVVKAETHNWPKNMCRVLSTNGTSLSPTLSSRRPPWKTARARDGEEPYGNGVFCIW